MRPWGPLMKRYGKKIEWDRKAVVVFSFVMLIAFGLSQVPNYLYVWPWGPNIGYRTAGLSSGHYERKFPTILRDMEQLGRVWIGRDTKLIITYDLTVHEGKTSFAIRRWPFLTVRAHNVGPGMIDDSRRGRIEVAPEHAGFYRINMHAYWFQGAVKVDWHTEKASR